METAVMMDGFASLDEHQLRGQGQAEVVVDHHYADGSVLTGEEDQRVGDEQHPQGEDEDSDPLSFDRCLNRVRALFVGQSIFRDLQCKRTAFFTVTDFLEPVSGTLVEDIALAMTAKIEFREADAIVSIADRTSGPLAHALAVRTGVPYTLANWYPKGSPGEMEIDSCKGFSGEGLIYLNGLRSRHKKVILAMDVLKTGATAANLVRGLQRHGVHVLHCIFACEIMEGKGRQLDPLNTVPVTSLVPIYLRGECTKEAPPPAPLAALLSVSERQHHRKQLLDGERSVTPTAQTLSPGGYRHLGPRSATPTANSSFPALEQVHAERAADSPGSATSGSANLPPGRLKSSFPPVDPIPRKLPTSIRSIKKMDNQQLRAKIDRVAATFINIPIHTNPHLSYPYSFFTLTDFVPLMTGTLVEDMADLCVYFGDFERCDVIVSEADRGGGPLAQAVSMRTGRPFLLANWYPSGEGLGAASNVQVGFSGEGNIVVNGVQPGQRCTFLDDMLSSGGTAEGVLRSITALGGIPVEGVFVSEKLYPSPNPRHLPMRKGKHRLKALWPHLEVTTVVQFVSGGERTTAPLNEIG